MVKCLLIMKCEGPTSLKAIDVRMNWWLESLLTVNNVGPTSPKAIDEVMRWNMRSSAASFKTSSAHWVLHW